MKYENKWQCNTAAVSQSDSYCFSRQPNIRKGQVFIVGVAIYLFHLLFLNTELFVQANDIFEYFSQFQFQKFERGALCKKVYSLRLTDLLENSFI